MSETQTPNGNSSSENNDKSSAEQIYSTASAQIQNIETLYEAAKKSYEDFASYLSVKREHAESGASEILEEVRNSAQDSKNDIEKLYSDTKELYSKKTGNIEDVKSNFETKVAEYIARANEKNETLTKEQDKITKKIDSLSVLHQECLEISQKITQVKEESSALKTSVETDIANIKEINTQFEALLKQSKTLQEELSNNHTALQKLLKDSQGYYKEINNLHIKLLTGEMDSNGKPIKISINEEVNTFYENQKKKLQEMLEFLSTSKNKVKEFMVSSQEQYAVLVEELKKEIRDLLPGAGAAGLSSAYVQAKSRYGNIEYDKGQFKLTGWEKVDKCLGIADRFVHYAVGNFSNLIYYLMFLAPLIYMFHHIDLMFQNIQNIDLKILVFKFLLALPLGLVSWFGFYSIRLNRRLYEEYNHKQRVMQLYHSFKQEIDEHGTEEHKKALIAMMIKAVQDKPSLTMHKYDKIGDDFYKTFLSNSIFPQKNEEN